MELPRYSIRHDFRGVKLRHHLRHLCFLTHPQDMLIEQHSSETDPPDTEPQVLMHDLREENERLTEEKDKLDQEYHHLVVHLTNNELLENIKFYKNKAEMIKEAYQTLIKDGMRFQNEERTLNADSNNWLWSKYPANNVITEEESISFVSENRFSPLENNYEEIEVKKYGCNEEKSFNSRIISNSKMKAKKQPSNKSKVIVAGDKIVEHVDQRKMSRNSTVKVRSFPGAKIEDVHHYTTPLLWEEPSTLIIHSGTNNLASEEPMITKDKLLDLKERIKELHPNTNVILSTLTLRTDNPE